MHRNRMFFIAIDSNPICVVAISKWGCILRRCTKVNDLIGHLAMNLFDVEDICSQIGIIKFEMRLIRLNS